jgi:hypothetical protein
MLPIDLAGKTRSISTRLSRRSTLVGIPIMVLLPRWAAAQESTQLTGEQEQLALPLPGTSAFEFVGRIHQLGMDFALNGYVTQMAGLSAEALFSGYDPLARSEADARITLVGSATGSARSILENLFVINAGGTIDFYAGSAGASFDDPDSFAAGTIVASASGQVQDIINVQAPQQGIATGYGDISLDTTDPFEIDGQSHVIARTGARFRLSFTGQGALLDPETLEAVILIAGNGVLIS